MPRAAVVMIIWMGVNFCTTVGLAIWAAYSKNVFLAVVAAVASGLSVAAVFMWWLITSLDKSKIITNSRRRDDAGSEEGG